MLAMGSRVRLGLLAHSATIVPMAGLIIFGAYRLGAATLGDTAGGIASLMLFFTNTFRRAVGVRGTAVAFGLVGVGLGLVLDRRARRSTFALGCLILGAAVASHTIDGGFAIAVASFAILLRDADSSADLVPQGRVPVWLGAASRRLISRSSTKTVLPYPILPLLQIAGIVAIFWGARALPQPPSTQRRKPRRVRSAKLQRGDVRSLRHRTGLHAHAGFPTPSMRRSSSSFRCSRRSPRWGCLLSAPCADAKLESIDGSPIIIALLVTIMVEMIARKLGAMEGIGGFPCGHR